MVPGSAGIPGRICGMSDARFVFGVDLDGCVATIFEGYRQSFARQLGVTADVFGPVTDYHLACWGPHVRDWSHYLALHDVAVSEGLFATVPPIPGAVDGLRELTAAGVYIRLITHRTGPDMAQVVSDTAGWLRDHRVPYDGLCFEGWKSDIAADIYLDDAPYQISGYAAAGCEAIVYSHPYNRHLPGRHARSWADVVDVVLDAKARKVSL